MPNQQQFAAQSDTLNPLSSVKAEVESAQCSALLFIKESGCWEYKLQAGFGGEDEQGEDQENLCVREREGTRRNRLDFLLTYSNFTR